jgi:hypothetical protein
MAVIGKQEIRVPQLPALLYLYDLDGGQEMGGRM